MDDPAKLLSILLAPMVELYSSRANLQQPVTQQGDADDGCCVCLDLMPANADVLHLPCSHFFHARCVREWLAVSASCPLCKTAVEIRRGALEVRAEVVPVAALDNLEPEFYGHAFSGRAVHVRTAEGGVLSAPTASFGARTPSAPASTVCAIM